MAPAVGRHKTCRYTVLDRLVLLSCQLQVTQGRKLRLDGTGVATPIHHPTDSPLHYDGVRVLSYALGRAKRLLQDGATLSQEMVTGCTQQARA